MTTLMPQPEKSLGGNTLPFLEPCHKRIRLDKNNAPKDDHVNCIVLETELFSDGQFQQFTKIGAYSENTDHLFFRAISLTFMKEYATYKHKGDLMTVLKMKTSETVDKLTGEKVDIYFTQHKGGQIFCVDEDTALREFVLFLKRLSNNRATVIFVPKMGKNVEVLRKKLRNLNMWEMNIYIQGFVEISELVSSESKKFQDFVESLEKKGASSGRSSLEVAKINLLALKSCFGAKLRSAKFLDKLIKRPLIPSSNSDISLKPNPNIDFVEVECSSKPDEVVAIPFVKVEVVQLNDSGLEMHLPVCICGIDTEEKYQKCSTCPTFDLITCENEVLRSEFTTLVVTFKDQSPTLGKASFKVFPYPALEGAHILEKHYVTNSATNGRVYITLKQTPYHPLVETELAKGEKIGEAQLWKKTVESREISRPLQVTIDPMKLKPMHKRRIIVRCTPLLKMYDLINVELAECLRGQVELRDEVVTVQPNQRVSITLRNITSRDLSIPAGRVARLSKHRIQKSVPLTCICDLDDEDNTRLCPKCPVFPILSKNDIQLDDIPSTLIGYIAQGSNLLNGHNVFKVFSSPDPENDFHTLWAFSLELVHNNQFVKVKLVKKNASTPTMVTAGKEIAIAQIWKRPQKRPLRDPMMTEVCLLNPLHMTPDFFSIHRTKISPPHDSKIEDGRLRLDDEILANFDCKVKAIDGLKLRNVTKNLMKLPASTVVGKAPLEFRVCAKEDIMIQPGQITKAHLECRGLDEYQVVSFRLVPHFAVRCSSLESLVAIRGKTVVINLKLTHHSTVYIRRGTEMGTIANDPVLLPPKWKTNVNFISRLLPDPASPLLFISTIATLDHKTQASSISIENILNGNFSYTVVSKFYPIFKGKFVVLTLRKSANFDGNSCEIGVDKVVASGEETTFGLPPFLGHLTCNQISHLSLADDQAAWEPDVARTVRLVSESERCSLNNHLAQIQGACLVSGLLIAWPMQQENLITLSETIVVRIKSTVALPAFKAGMKMAAVKCIHNDGFFDRMRA